MAENLWALREQKKVSVATLANRTGLAIGLILEYESGLRSIDPRHLARLAKALYIEASQIKLQSDPRPGMAPLERLPSRGPQRTEETPPPTPMPRPKERSSQPKPAPHPPAPARPSQITHLETLLRRLQRKREDVEAELGRPLAELDRLGMSNLLKALQAQVAEAGTPTRHRAYLPEAVDEFESRYLTAVQAAGDPLHFELFDGRALEGTLIGYGQYAFTIRLADGSELTLNKLAVVSYHRAPSSGVRQEPLR